MILAINLKAYKEVLGKIEELVEVCERVKEEYDIDIIVAPQFTELYKACQKAKKVKIFAQHVDPIEPGAHTGWILPESLKNIGVKGTILNHSEHPIKINDLYYVIKRCKELGLETLVCAPEPIIGKAIAVFEPDYVAVEPPELIGTGISVSKAKPEIVQKAVEIIKEINPKVRVLVGAGITNKDDVKKAIELGADGVLLASAVAKAHNYYEKIKELAEGFK